MAKIKLLKTKYKSIFKYKTNDGFRYLIRLCYRNEYGERKEKSESGFLTIEDAKKRHLELELLVCKGTNLSSLNRMKFGEWFEKYYKMMTSSWTIVTQKRICSEYENHLSHFSDKWITRITLMDVQQFVNLKLKEGLAVSTVKNIYKTMMQIMNAAVKHDLIVKNKLIYVVFPKAEKKVSKLIEQDDLNRLDIYVYNQFNILEQAMYVLARNGWRGGEVAGLTFGACDIKDDENVVVSVKKTRNHYTKEKGEKPKTNASYRENYLTGDNSKRIISAIQTAEKYYEELGISKCSDHFVFFNPNTKKPYHPTRLSQILKKANQALDLAITPHMLRHTLVSNLIKNGASPIEVSRWVGHARLDTTLNTYTHSSKEEYANLINVISKA